MLWVLGPAITAVSVLTTFFLTDRSHWRKFLLIAGIIGAVLSAWQGYSSRNQLTDLRSVIAGRPFTPERIGQIAEDLKAFSGRRLFIASYTGDNEAARLGLQIKAALLDAGILVSDELGSVRAGPGGIDFRVHISGPETDRMFLLEAIRNSLVERGKLDVSKTFLVPRVSIDGDVIGIMIAFNAAPSTRSGFAN